MLKIVIPSGEVFDEKQQCFINFEGQTLSLEHSLVSLSKWESKWCKPFLSKGEKTVEETIDYIRCMTITKNVNPIAYTFLSNKNIEEVNNYVQSPMTATTFSGNNGGKSNNEQITAELVYYWMIALNIPFNPCEKWHLNKLLTLIRVCSIKNQPDKKMSNRSVMSQNAALNAARRKKFNSKG